MGGWAWSGGTTTDYSGYLLLCSKGYCGGGPSGNYYGGGILYSRGTAEQPYWVDHNCTHYTISTSGASDYRLKENLCCWSTLCCTTNVVKNIPVYSFGWSNAGLGYSPLDSSSTKRVGFLAHEVKEAINVNRIVVGEKDALNPTGEIVPQTVDHSAMVPILWSALQETIKRVETLEAEVETLKNS
jgi:hypothetical protein